MQFGVRQHSILQNQQIVEVMSDDGRLLAVIYPHEQGLHIVSKYITGHARTEGLLPMPGLLVLLDQK